MAIEPISSAMTYQMQNAPQTKPVSKPEMVDTDVRGSQQQTVEFDPTTVKIQNVDEKDSGNQSSSNNSSFADRQEANAETIKKAVENLNKNLNNSEAIFGIHEATNRVTIKIVDKETKEVIKELPPEKTLDMIAKAWELAGILVDERR